MATTKMENLTIADSVSPDEKLQVSIEPVKVLNEDGAAVLSESFECEICMETIESGAGMKLCACSHLFCKQCIANSVKHDSNVMCKCPNKTCDGELQDHEIRAAVSDVEYDNYKMRSIRAAQQTIKGSVICATADCIGWYIADSGVAEFDCEICEKRNCIPCKVSHD